MSDTKHLRKPIRTTLSAQIIEQMEQHIKDNDWPVGSKIPGEFEMMDIFGVSRNTIREATLSLVHAGLLYSKPGDGTYVISRDRLDVALHRRLRENDLDDVIELRCMLETQIAFMACQRSTEEDLLKLKEAKELRDGAELNTDAFVKCDIAFHLQLAKQCHNKLIFDLYYSCMQFIEEEILLYQIRSENYRQHEEHDALFRAIVARDSVSAVSAIRSLLKMERECFHKAKPFNTDD